MVAKSCTTCDCRANNMCTVSGLTIKMARLYHNSLDCQSNFEMWKPRRGFHQRVKDWFFGVQK